MLYEESLQLFEELKELLNFQERRNFFNRKQDIHIISCIKIIDTILEKNQNTEFNNDDLADVINIVVQIISILDINDTIREHLDKMLIASTELKKNTLTLKNV